MRGRIGQPAAVHLARGSFRADRHAGRPEPQAATPKPPADLDKRGRRSGDTIRRSYCKWNTHFAGARDVGLLLRSRRAGEPRRKPSLPRAGRL